MIGVRITAVTAVVEESEVVVLVTGQITGEWRHREFLDIYDKNEYSDQSVTERGALTQSYRRA